MNKKICVECQLSYKAEEYGVLILELFQRDSEIYKIWFADLYRCPGCGREMIAGFSDKPLAVHYQKELMKKALEIVEDYKTKRKGVYYWREFPKEKGVKIWPTE